MKCPLQDTEMAERALSVMLDDDGYARRYCRLTLDAAEQARLLLAGLAHARKRRYSALIARRLGMPEVPR